MLSGLFSDRPLQRLQGPFLPLAGKVCLLVLIIGRRSSHFDPWKILPKDGLEAVILASYLRPSAYGAPFIERRQGHALERLTRHALHKKLLVTRLLR